jgi:uncharacterized protein YbbC (DUF1343 family)
MSAVIVGLDSFVEEGPEIAGLRRDCRVGLAAHAASVDRRARHAVELLRDMPGLRLARLFAPEHGLWGCEQDMEPVGRASDPASGIQVSSLYGDDPSSLRPRVEELADLDAVLVDFQDVGSRYYTYAYTLSYIMEAARDAGRPVVVLDRPNPIGGIRVEGPVLDPSLASFVGRYPLPVRHGLTLGELARLFNEAHGIGCDLRVVPLRGWSREMSFAGTGLPWVPPSPNMPSTTTAELYPGACLLEGTNLSEGRGTASPFELTGAPWLDGGALARSLRRQSPPGALFREAAFRPMFGKHGGCSCSGVQVIIGDLQAFEPFATYLLIIREARRLASESFAWRSEPYEFESRRLAIDLLLGREELRPMLESGAPIEELKAAWEPGLRRFAEQRSRFLIYR